MASRKSVVARVTDDEFRRAVAGASSISDAMREIGLCPTSSGQRVLFRRRCSSLGVATDVLVQKALEMATERLASRPAVISGTSGDRMIAKEII